MPAPDAGVGFLVEARGEPGLLVAAVISGPEPPDAGDQQRGRLGPEVAAAARGRSTRSTRLRWASGSGRSPGPRRPTGPVSGEFRARLSAGSTVPQVDRQRAAAVGGDPGQQRGRLAGIAVALGRPSGPTAGPAAAARAWRRRSGGTRNRMPGKSRSRFGRLIRMS